MSVLLPSRVVQQLTGIFLLEPQTAAQAAHYPFFGIWGPYRSEMDPWQLAAKKPPPPREYLWFFYNQTAQYLTDQVRLL